MPSATPEISTWISTPQTDLEFYATIRDQGDVVMDGVPVSGSLTWVAPAAIVRTGQVVFQTLATAELARGLAMGWTADVFVRVAQNETFDVPLGRYRAISVSWVPGSVNVDCQVTDELTLVADAQYIAPFTARKGWSHVGALRRVCAVPGVAKDDATHAKITRVHDWGNVPIGDDDTSPLRKSITEDRERIELFTTLNKQGKVETFFDTTGRLICRQPPRRYYRSRPGRADYVLTDASLFRLDAMGFDRTTWFNQLAIQPTDTSQKFWHVQKKVSSGDYRYGERFGARPIIYTSDAIDTKTEAVAAIDELLEEQTTPAHTLTITAPPYWWIEAGDVAGLPGDPMPRYYVAQAELPLSLGDMKLQLTAIGDDLYMPGEP